MMYRNKKLTESAKHEACVYFGRTGDVVWAHSDESKHGKGKGIKSHDLFGAYLCYEAHNDYGLMPNVEFVMKYGQYKKEWFREMWERSMIIACEKGYLK